MRFDGWRNAWRKTAYSLGNQFDVSGCRTATATDYIQPAALRPFLQLRRQTVGGLRKSCREQRIGQPSIRMATHRDRSQVRKLFNQRAHFLGTERTIDPDAQQRDVGNGIPEGFNRLTRHPTITAGLYKRDRGHERKSDVSILEKLVDGKERSFRIERIEDSLDQQEIDSAVD